jgi:uncharacterized coiled-coil protein SlyX
MADQSPQETAERQAPQGPSPGGLVKKLFAKKDDAAQQGNKAGRPDQGVAQVPATLLTVEYVDDSEGMDAAIKEMSDRLRKLEEQSAAMLETQTRLVAALNQQAKDIGKMVESLGRRIDRLYRRVSGGEVVAARQEEQAPAEEPEEAAADTGQVSGMAAMGLSPEVADKPEHQNAWRVARVLAADLEAYHEEAVREGVLYGTFYSVLREPIESARKAYEQRVSREIVDGYDYFSKALDELIARKRIELEETGAL